MHTPPPPPPAPPPPGGSKGAFAGRPKKDPRIQKILDNVTLSIDQKIARLEELKKNNSNPTDAMERKEIEEKLAARKLEVDVAIRNIEDNEAEIKAKEDRVKELEKKIIQSKIIADTIRKIKVIIKILEGEKPCLLDKKAIEEKSLEGVKKDGEKTLEEIIAREKFRDAIERDIASLNSKKSKASGGKAKATINPGEEEFKKIAQGLMEFNLSESKKLTKSGEKKKTTDPNEDRKDKFVFYTEDECLSIADRLGFDTSDSEDDLRNTLQNRFGSVLGKPKIGKTGNIYAALEADPVRAGKKYTDREFLEETLGFNIVDKFQERYKAFEAEKQRKVEEKAALEKAAAAAAKEGSKSSDLDNRTASNLSDCDRALLEQLESVKVQHVLSIARAREVEELVKREMAARKAAEETAKKEKEKAKALEEKLKQQAKVLPASPTSPVGGTQLSAAAKAALIAKNKKK